MGEMIKLTTKDGATVGAYKAEPSGKPRAGIVVLQEIFGVNHHIRKIADGFAAEGYLVIAPALFDRVAPNIELGYGPEDFKQGMEIRARTKLEDTLADIEAAVAAAAQAGVVGIVGYCWGGTMAYAAAAHLSGLAGVVAYYGSGIAGMVHEALRAPVEFHFGERDKSIPPEDIEKIRAAHPDSALYIYPADHGFNCDSRPSYDEQSAALAKSRTLAFFAHNLL
ncbi:MAG: dienelactone hydrolase family protein [Methylovirgula sp.]